MTAVTGSGMFIRVEVDESIASDRDIATKLAGVCPVDIFAERERSRRHRRCQPR